jgi:hypothetical protein
MERLSGIDDHYFETRFIDLDGYNVPPRRYRTLRWAKARAETLSLDGCGSIWYQGETGEVPLEMIRYPGADALLITLHQPDPIGKIIDGFGDMVTLISEYADYILSAAGRDV